MYYISKHASLARPSRRSRLACLARMCEASCEAPRMFRHRLNGYLVLQGNIPLRTSQFMHFLKLLAGNKLRYQSG